MEISENYNTCKEYVGDSLVDVNIVDSPHNDGRVLLYTVKCARCGKLYGLYTYSGRSCFLCNDCYKKRQKEKIEEAQRIKKEKEKEVIRKHMKKYKIPKIRKTMCEQYCVISKLVTDENERNKACENCPLVSLESGAE